jgi:micrococcal nuclease
VIDGDTIKANCEGRGLITIRQIGIDTPEKGQCYADRATAEANRLMGHNTIIDIVQDLSQAKEDKYGRTLAYIRFRPDDMYGGYGWGEDALRNGYAKEYTYDKPYAQQASYKQAQAEAVRESRGLWGACTW